MQASTLRAVRQARAAFAVVRGKACEKGSDDKIFG